MAVEEKPILREHRPHAAGDGESREVCAGCRELTLRVERLEARLAAGFDVGSQALGTTACYWICLAVHAVVTFTLCSSAFTVSIAMLPLLGAFGTAVVCHVLSTRPILEKSLRTLLSFSLVILSAVIPMQIAGVMDMTDIFPTVMIYSPPMFFSGWFVAKLFVWIRRWRIAPPGYNTELPKLKIRHLMGSTLVVAVYLGGTRYLASGEIDFSGTELLLGMAYVAIPTAVATILASVMARLILSRRGHLIRNLLLFTTITFISGMLIYAIISMYSGTEIGGEEMMMLVTYGVALLVGLLASPAFTFAMLRQSGYRILVGRTTVESIPAGQTEND